jgi:hypothetical protein
VNPLRFCYFDGRTAARKEDREYREEHWKRLDFDAAHAEGSTLFVPCGCGSEHRLITDSPPAVPHRDEGGTWYWREPADGELAERRPIDDLLRRYRESVRDITRAFELLDGAEARMQTTLRGRHGRVLELPTAADVLEQLRRSTWAEVVSKLEIRRLLSIKMARELDQRLEKGELPEPTLETVASFGAFYQENTAAMLTECVREVFDLLRPRCSHYKTNTEFEIRERVILSWMIESGWSHPFRVRYDRAQDLLALERVMMMLDGRGVIAKTANGELVDAINRCAQDGRGRTEYFAFRACRNGSLHLTFLKPALVAKLNRIAGGKNLRPKVAA